MIKLNVELENHSYPIYVASSYERLTKALATAKIGKKVVIITDKNVEKLQSSILLENLKTNGYETFLYSFEPGEQNKNITTIEQIYSFLVNLKLDRNSTILALGGGVVGDMAGFVAATFLRGINFIQVPTTFLSVADSSVGGKVGFDFDGHKNIVGAFYQPKLVYINVSNLKTLPEREISSGLAEIIKHGLILDEEFLDYVDYNIPKIFHFNEEVLMYIAKMNCTIKKSVVEKDEKESGLRAVLNFGHTYGHAIETVLDFKLLHGECVSLGIVAAFRLAELLELVDEETTGKVIGILTKAKLPTYLPGLDIEKIYNQMFFDKKAYAGKLNFILPKKIGEVVQIKIEDEMLIKEALEKLDIREDSEIL